MHFCATCDGAFYREGEVLVVGGGNSGGEESVFLTRFAKKVTIVTKDPHLSASRVAAAKVAEHPSVEVRTSITPVELPATPGCSRWWSLTPNRTRPPS